MLGDHSGSSSLPAHPSVPSPEIPCVKKVNHVLGKVKHVYSSRSWERWPLIPLLLLGWWWGWCPMHCFVETTSTLIPTISVSTSKIPPAPPTYISISIFFGYYTPLCHLHRRLEIPGSCHPLWDTFNPWLLGTWCINTLLPCSQKHVYYSALHSFPIMMKLHLPIVVMGLVRHYFGCLFSLVSFLHYPISVSLTFQINSSHSNPCLSVCLLEEPKLRYLSIPYISVAHAWLMIWQIETTFERYKYLCLTQAY